MSQQYTEVEWQDPAGGNPGTLINKARLDQMQTAHHYADGFEEVDSAPTADPGVDYHKVVYCTGDSTFYRWDGTQWQKDVDDETKALLLAHEADHDNPHVVTKAQVGLGNADNTSDLDKPISTATQTALDGKLDKQTAGSTQTKVYAVRGSVQRMLNAGYGMGEIPLYNYDLSLAAKMPTLLDPTDETVVNYGWANTELAKKADKSTTYTKVETDTLLAGKADAATTLAGYGITDAYTKSEADTLLGAKADQATTYTKSEVNTALALKADKSDTYTKTETDTLLSAKANDNAVVHLAGAETIPGAKTFTDNVYLQKSTPEIHILHTLSETSVTPTGNRTSKIRFNDKNDSQEATIAFNHFTTGSKRLTQLITPESGANVEFQLNVNNDATEAYMTGPARAYNASNTSDVATIATLDAYTPMLRTTGNQPIGGIKTVEGTINGLSNINNGRLYAYHGSGDYWRKKINILQDTSWCAMFMIKSAVIRGTNGPAIFVYQRRAGTSDFLDWIYKPAGVTMQIGVNNDGIYVFQNGSDGLSIELLGQIASQSSASSIISIANDEVLTDPVFRVTI